MVHCVPAQLCSRSGVLVLTGALTGLWDHTQSLSQPLVTSTRGFRATTASSFPDLDRASSLASPVQHWELDWSQHRALLCFHL